MPSDAALIVPATPDPAAIASHLLFLTMQPLTSYWMGVEDERSAIEILARMYRGTRNLFSHQFADLALVDGAPVGLLLAYTAPTMKRLEILTLLHFIRAAGLMAAFRMVWRSLPLQGIVAAAPDEYFLAHLAVLPEFEGRGIGQQLLHRAEDRAREASARKLTLTVEAENSRAIELYSRFGMSITATINLEPLRRRFGWAGYHHMAKDVR
ncbi:MAG TPA: GNAT family N-acetyltransferase [Anaerolineales bacterium]